jgi:hypothetical protein
MRVRRPSSESSSRRPAAASGGAVGTVARLPKRVVSGLTTFLSSLAGAALGAASFVTAVATSEKPLHAVGMIGHGTLSIQPTAAATGVPFLDRRSSTPVLARWSRATNRPTDSVDIDGLALRLQDAGDDGDADLLFSSTGSGIPGRFVLQPRRPGRPGVMSTLMPTTSPMGPLLLRIEPAGRADPRRPCPCWTLSRAFLLGRWHSIGVLEVSWQTTDEPVRFDPVRHPLAGAPAYRWVRAIREPAYRAARHGAPRPASPPDPEA